MREDRAALMALLSGDANLSQDDLIRQRELQRIRVAWNIVLKMLPRSSELAPTIVSS